MLRKTIKKIGDTYGRLEIIEYLGSCRPGNHHRYFLCKCACGNKVEVRTDNLGKDTRSCGCLQVTKKVGDIYDRLKIIEDLGTRQTGNRKKHRRYYLCECICGNKVEVLGECLGNGTKSCGCLNRENAADKLKSGYDKLFVEGTNIKSISSNKLSTRNRSGVRGVSWNSHRNKWRATISFKKRNYYLGSYSDIEEAARIRKEAEDRIFGEFLEWYRNRVQ